VKIVVIGFCFDRSYCEKKKVTVISQERRYVKISFFYYVFYGFQSPIIDLFSWFTNKRNLKKFLKDVAEESKSPIQVLYPNNKTFIRHDVVKKLHSLWGRVFQAFQSV